MRFSIKTSEVDTLHMRFWELGKSQIISELRTKLMLT